MYVNKKNEYTEEKMQQPTTYIANNKIGYHKQATVETKLSCKQYKAMESTCYW